MYITCYTTRQTHVIHKPGQKMIAERARLTAAARIT
jgi:hypothetical protein